MLIDLTISAGSLVEQLRNQLASVDLVVCEDLGGPFAGLVFDRVDFDAPILSRRMSSMIPILLADGSPEEIEGHSIGIAVGAHVMLASREDLIEGGVNGATNTTQLDLTLQFDLRGVLDVDEDGAVTAHTRLSYLGTDPELPDPRLRDLVDAHLAAVEQSTPVDLADLEATLGRAVSLRNFGIALDSEAKRIVTRIEVETTASDPKEFWESFYASPPDRRDGRDWALFVDQRLLVMLAEERFAAGLLEGGAFSQLKVIDAPVGLWQPMLPGLQLFCYVDVLDACPNGLNVGVELFAESVFSLSSQAAGMDLKTVTTLRWNTIDSDVLACGLTTGGLLGIGIGAAAGGWIGAIVGGVVGTALVTSIGAIYAAEKSPPEKPAGEGCKVTAEDDDHVVTTCRQAFEPPEPLSLRLIPEMLAGLFDGLAIRGAVETVDAAGSLVITVTPLEWSEHLNCNTQSVDVSLSGGVSLVDSRLLPLTTCEPEVVDDALGYFSAEWVEPGHFEIQLNDAVADQYNALPKQYPCRVIVRTNLGARGFDLGSLARAPGPEDFGDITGALAKNCFRAHADFWHSHLSFEWIVDPPWDNAVVRHVWDIVASGLRPGDSVRVMHGRADVVARAQANAQGLVRLRAVVPPSKATLSIGRVPSKDRQSVNEAFDPKRHVLGVTQTLLVARGRSRLAGRCRKLVPLRGIGRTQLVALTDVGLEVWDRRGSQVLALRTRLRDPSLNDLVVTNRGLIAFGTNGARRFESQEDGRLVGVRSVSEADRRIFDALANKPSEVAQRADTPSTQVGEAGSDWFAETVKLGKHWLARVGADRHHVVLYSVGRPTSVRIPFVRR